MIMAIAFAYIGALVGFSAGVICRAAWGRN